jgi:transposase
MDMDTEAFLLPTLIYNIMQIIGIDISKAWFDCFCSMRATHKRFKNTAAGWKQVAEWAQADAHVVMEASGPYYLGLASWLHARGFTVSVVNPLVIRRYGQMTLSRTKTDAKDALLIAEYGRDQHPEPWNPPSAVCQALRQLMSLREGLLRQQAIITGQTEAFSQCPADPLVMELLGEQRERVRQGIQRVDRRLQALATEHYQAQLEALLTIPGIGPKTAIMLLAITDGFRRFDSARKLASYVGICPRVWQSGSSVKGRGSICKLGCAPLRKLLYMCSWTAKRCNPACKQLYQRLAGKGKPEKVIKVAIAHKLLRQAFAVGKNQEPFDKKKAMAA